MNPKAHSCLFLSLSLFLFFSSPDLLAESPGIPGDDAPRVVSIVPKNGVTDVDSGLDEIKITFSEPMLVTFKTRGKGAKKKKTGKGDLPSLGELEFSLLDANGLEVKSQDYKGVPLFIAFGAAW